MMDRGRVYWSLVYPRECGAAGHAESDELLIRGLSPRVRGSPLGDLI